MASRIWKQFEQESVGIGMAMSAVAILITTIPVLVTLGLQRRGGMPGRRGFAPACSRFPRQAIRPGPPRTYRRGKL